MKILVTGGLGYIGSKLVEVLKRNKEYDIYIYDIKKDYKDTNNHVINNFNSLKNFLKSNHVEKVLHLGATTGFNELTNSTNEFHKNIVVNTAELFNVCTKYGRIKEFVFFSTVNVYGVGNLSFKESQKCNPLSLYGKYKLEAEKILINKKNIITKIIRVANVYGESPQMRYNTLINGFCKKIAEKQPIYIYSGILDEIRPFIHVSDLANFVAKFIKIKKERNIVINASTENIKVEEFFNILLKRGIDYNYIQKDRSFFMKQQKNNYEIKNLSYGVNNEKMLDVYNPQYYFKNSIVKLIKSIPS